MKTSDFKRFKEIVSNAELNDPIWHAGFLWIDLTKKQGAEIISILRESPICEVKKDRLNRLCVFIPSGLGLVIE